MNVAQTDVVGAVRDPPCTLQLACTASCNSTAGPSDGECVHVVDSYVHAYLRRSSHRGRCIHVRIVDPCSLDAGVGVPCLCCVLHVSELLTSRARPFCFSVKFPMIAFSVGACRSNLDMLGRIFPSCMNTCKSSWPLRFCRSDRRAVDFVGKRGLQQAVDALTRRGTTMSSRR